MVPGKNPSDQPRGSAYLPHGARPVNHTGRQPTPEMYNRHAIGNVVNINELIIQSGML